MSQNELYGKYVGMDVFEYTGRKRRQQGSDPGSGTGARPFDLVSLMVQGSAAGTRRTKSVIAPSPSVSLPNV